MHPDEFLRSLHFEIDKVRPVDLEVDWNDAPLPYKLYRHLDSVSFTSELPLAFDDLPCDGQGGVSLNTLGTFLWYAYGLTQVCQSFVIPDGLGERVESMQMLRRFAPSGGALYPCELYAYLKIDELSAGIYHYDVAHHRLVLLREGNYDEFLDAALGQRVDVSSCFGVLFVSVCFWKNFFKYHNFSYRLQGLDTGVLVGQLLEVAQRHRFASAVCYQFLDEALNHLLGLASVEESVYAVVPLRSGGEMSGSWTQRQGTHFEAISDEDLCATLPPLFHSHYMKSKRITPYPQLIEMNQSSIMSSTKSIRTRRLDIRKVCTSDGHGPGIELPEKDEKSVDFASACRNRYSPGLDFMNGRIRLGQLATLLWDSTAGLEYVHDLDEALRDRLQVELVGCFHGVDGVPDGAYLYRPGSHTLRLLRNGDHRFRLQEAMSWPNVNLLQVPMCFHITSRVGHLKESLGDRGYRTQQMEAGILLQRLLVTASSLGLGGHPLLGYDAAVIDEIYGIQREQKTCLVQVPVGLFQTRSRIQSGLHG